MLDSLAFDKINTFDFFPLFYSLKQLSLYTVKDREKNQKWIFIES